jgi:hypothetical protein
MGKDYPPSPFASTCTRRKTLEISLQSLQQNGNEIGREKTSKGME